MNKTRGLVIIIIFLAIILGGTCINGRNILTIFGESSRERGISWNEKSSNIESQLNSSFALKGELVNIFGLSQKIMGKHLIGNFEYIKDDNDIMHMYSGELSTENFIDGMNWLKNETNQRGIPLLYVQIPDRVIDGFTKASWGVEQTSNEDIVNEVLASLSETGINCLDLREDLKSGVFDYDDFFFKTDIHLTTEAEWYILGKIVDELENAGCELTNKNGILDKNNYNLVSNSFLGNLARMTGKYYTELDNFERYYPIFETNYTRTHMVTGEKFTGCFSDIVMNQYPKEGSYTTYWVTDYMQFTNPFYNFENLLTEKDTNVLIIMDSFGFRTAAYLSLMLKNLTVIDTRYQGRYNMADWAFQLFDFDAVIVLQSTSLLSTDFMPVILKSPDASILSTTTPTYVTRGETYSIEINVQNTGSEAWSSKEQVRLCIFQDGVDYGYRVDLPEGIIILPGEEYTFVQKDFQAPANSYTYIEYQMVQEGIAYFGEKKYVPVIVKGELDFQADILSADYYEENGKNFFRAEVKNCSNFTWSDQYRVRLALFEDSSDTGTRIVIAEGQNVLPGDSYIFEWETNAVNSAEIKLGLQMVYEGIRYFGEQEILVRIN